MSYEWLDLMRHIVQDIWIVEKVAFLPMVINFSKKLSIWRMLLWQSNTRKQTYSLPIRSLKDSILSFRQALQALGLALEFRFLGPSVSKELAAASEILVYDMGVAQILNS